MSQDAQADDGSKQGPAPQGADTAAQRRSRSVPPVIDLEAEPAGGERSTTPSRHVGTGLALKSLGLGALAGAVAGAITVLLIYSTALRTPDDAAKRDDLANRLAALESNRAITPEQGAVLDQKITALDQKSAMATQKIGALDEKLSALEGDASSLKAAIAALPRDHAEAERAALSARIDALTLALETLSAKPAHDQNTTLARIAGGLSLAFGMRGTLHAGGAIDRDLAALDALQIEGLSLAPLRAALNQTRLTTESETAKSDAPPTNDVVSKFWMMMSRLVTISPADKNTTASSPLDASANAAVERLIDDLTTRLVEESAAP